MRYIALQGDHGWVLFKWMKRGAIIWCLPKGPKSRSQVLESSWGMLSTWPGERRASVSRSLPAPALLQTMRGQLGASISYQAAPTAARTIFFNKSEAIKQDGTCLLYLKGTAPLYAVQSSPN